MKKKEKERLYDTVLIDGSSFIYRSYFAIPKDLSSSKGIPTKAIFGVTQMLFKILKDFSPQIIIWFADEPKPTFRHEKFKDYKAHRPCMPEDLKIQIPYIKKIVELLGIPWISHPGYEADDLIATFIKTFSIPCVIIGGDSDLYPLISENVVLYDPIKNRFLDLKWFKTTFGFPPERYPEFKALVGDKSDNIPGVPSIGEKTAKNLLNQFSSLEELFNNLNKVSPQRVRKLLEQYKDQVLENLKIVALNTDSPLPSTELSFYHKLPPKIEELREIFKELEFRKLLKELTIQKPFEVKELKDLKLDQIDVPVSLYISDFPEKKKVISMFEENKPQVFIGISEKEVGVFSISSLEDLTNSKIPVIFVYDYKNFVKNSYKLRANSKILDVKLASYILNPNKKDYSLETLFNEELDVKLVHPKEYCAGIYILGNKFKKQLEEEGLWEWEWKIEAPLSEVLAEMESHGVKIDIDYLKTLLQEFQKKLKNLEERMYSLVGTKFNPRSSQEVAKILFHKLNLPKVKTTPKSKIPSTDAEVLKELATLHPLPNLLLEYRYIYKLKSTYLEPFLKMADTVSHRIHTEFNQTGTATGRLSSQNPNLQNIPIKGEEGKKIRKIFIAEKGYVLLSVDYSQIELRILAHFSQDENLLKAFEEGKDIHSFTASEIFNVPMEKITPEMRRLAKAINFGIAYGMSAYGLSKELQISVSSAEEFIKKYFARYPKIKVFIEEIVKFAKENGYVKTIVGRKRYVPELKSSNYATREMGKRIAINTPIQGSAADLIKCAMVALFKKLKELNLETKIILQVHDELLLEVPEKEKEIVIPLVKEIMEKPFEKAGLNIKLNVPIKVNICIGETWADCN